jgi:hypothetical protein
MSKKLNFETYQFICHCDIIKYKSQGWIIIDDLKSCHHGHYSVLMKAPKEWENDQISKE